MEPLQIEEIGSMSGMKTMRISGFTDEELYGLKKLSHYDARNRLLDMLDDRNGKIGTCWQNGYGVYGIWFDNEYAYVNIGNSCD